MLERFAKYPEELLIALVDSRLRAEKEMDNNAPIWETFAWFRKNNPRVYEDLTKRVHEEGKRRESGQTETTITSQETKEEIRKVITKRFEIPADKALEIIELDRIYEESGRDLKSSYLYTKALWEACPKIEDCGEEVEWDLEVISGKLWVIVDQI